MDHAIWWDGVAGALIGAVLGSLIGSGIPLWSARKGRRIERRGEISAMQAELYHARVSMGELLTDGVMAPLYRLPLDTFERAVPKLIGEGALTSEETAVLIEYVMRIEELNRGLDRAGQAAITNQPALAAEEFNRNCLKTSNILTEKLPRRGQRTVYEATWETVFRVEDTFKHSWLYNRVRSIVRSGKVRPSPLVSHENAKSPPDEAAAKEDQVKTRASWLHWTALLFELVGSLLVFLEARRFSAQLQAAGHVDYAGAPPPGFQDWWHNSGGIGFALLAGGVVLTATALFVDRGRDGENDRCTPAPAEVPENENPH